MDKPKISLTQERRATLSDAVRDEGSRTLRAALSSELPVRRSFGDEILAHEHGAINFERAGAGLPLLVNHDAEALPIGRVGDIRLEDGVLRGTLQFSEATQAARDAWELAREGTLSDVSIRYQIHAYETSTNAAGDDAYRITSWTPMEVSAVSVPADPTVGIGRQIDFLEDTMSESSTPAAPEPVSETPRPSASRNAGIAEGQRAERERQTAIDDIAANFLDNAAVIDLAATAKREGHSVSDFKDAVLGAVSGPPSKPLAAPVPVPEHVSSSVTMGRTSGEGLRTALLESMDIAVGNIRGKEARELASQNEFVGRPCIEIARMCLESGGIDTRGMAPLQIAEATFSRYIDPGTANLATTDFTHLLENVMNKALFRGFEEAPVVWNRFCGTDSVADFKQASRPTLSQFTSLATVAENAAIQDGIVTDKTEKFTVETYSRKFSLTRQALVNDDLAAFGTMASRMGQAAARTVDEVTIALIESNPTMGEDATAMFDATHGNLLSGSPTTANISQARVAMGKQEDHNNIVLGIVPQYMLVPLELEEEMLVLKNTIVDPDATDKTRDNVYRALWEPVSSARLTDVNDWYMFGNRGDHFNVAFLNGQQSPMMARDEGWSVLAAHWRVVLDFTVYPVDWRAAVKFANV